MLGSGLSLVSAAISRLAVTWTLSDTASLVAVLSGLAVIAQVIHDWNRRRR